MAVPTKPTLKPYSGQLPDHGNPATWVDRTTDFWTWATGDGYNNSAQTVAYAEGAMAHIDAALNGSADMTAFMARTDNPHGVTAAQVGAYTQGEADSRFVSEDPGYLRPMHMGNYLHGANVGVKRFNFKLLGVGAPSTDSRSFRVEVKGYAYGSGKAIDMVFVGYSYANSGAVINSQASDLAGSGLACGVTRTPTGVYVWIEANSYFFNASVWGVPVQPAPFDAAAGFEVVQTAAGVAVT